MSKYTVRTTVRLTFNDLAVLRCFYLPTFYNFDELFKKFKKIDRKHIVQDFEKCTGLHVKENESEPLMCRFGRSLLKLNKLGFIETLPCESAIVYVTTELGDEYIKINSLE